MAARVGPPGQGQGGLRSLTWPAGISANLDLLHILEIQVGQLLLLQWLGGHLRAAARGVWGHRGRGLISPSSQSSPGLVQLPVERHLLLTPRTSLPSCWSHASQGPKGRGTWGDGGAAMGQPSLRSPRAPLGCSGLGAGMCPSKSHLDLPNAPSTSPGSGSPRNVGFLAATSTHSPSRPPRQLPPSLKALGAGWAVSCGCSWGVPQPWAPPGRLGRSTG